MRLSTQLRITSRSAIPHISTYKLINNYDAVRYLMVVHRCKTLYLYKCILEQVGNKNSLIYLWFKGPARSKKKCDKHTLNRIQPFVLFITRATLPVCLVFVYFSQVIITPWQPLRWIKLLISVILFNEGWVNTHVRRSKLTVIRHNNGHLITLESELRWKGGYSSFNDKVVVSNDNQNGAP